jgi:hypothetical protein
MGFMDKGKKLAEQAQQKLDEAQQNFSKSSSPQAEPQAGETRYDEHGRPVQDPVQDSPPAGEAPPPPADPAPTGDQADATPDPFKPLQQ